MTPRSRRGKHAPTRLSTYLKTHETVLRQLVDEGFVRSADALVISAFEGGILMEGTLDCLGGIRIDIEKRIMIVGAEDSDPLVATDSYSYNVSLEDRGNVFRYDSPHEHRSTDHKHEFDVLAGDKDGSVKSIHSEDHVPTLGEVIQEARDWYWKNLGALR